MSSDWLDDLLVGMGVYLHAQGAITWSSGAVDPAAVPPPMIKGAIPDKPDVAVGMLPYSGTDDPDLADVVQPVQFWIRGTKDIATATAVGSAIFNALHGRVGLTIGGIPCPLIVRNSAAPMGVDGSGRWQFAHNYYVSAMRPTYQRTE